MNGLLSTEQYENIIASLQLEAINFEGDERFAPIAKLIERLAYEIPICKRYVTESGYSSYLHVGYLNTKGDIILYEPKKVVHQIDYQNPIQYQLGFYTYPTHSGDNVVKVKNSTSTSLPVYQCNQIEEVMLKRASSEVSIGYYKDRKITYWEQYTEY